MGLISTLTRKALADVTRRKGRSLLILLGIFIAVLGLTAVNLANDTSGQQFLSVVAPSDVPNATFFAASLSPATLTALRHAPNVATVEVRTQLRAGWKLASGETASIDLDSYPSWQPTTLNTFQLTTGCWPGRGEIVMASRDHFVQPVTLGDTVTLTIADGLRERVCTADALHTHAEFQRLMHELQGDSLLTVKGNQPTLYADLATYFADPQARYLQAETVDRRRGRTEVRTLKVSTEMNAYLAPSWPFVAQVAQLTRTVTKAGKTTTEVVYLITTLAPSKASPQRLLELNRGHGRIENGSHYVRDVTFSEDRSRLRTGNAPQILAALRNRAITLIHRFGSSHIRATRHHFASCPQQALALPGFPTGGQQ